MANMRSNCSGLSCDESTHGASYKRRTSVRVAGGDSFSTHRISELERYCGRARVGRDVLCRHFAPALARQINAFADQHRAQRNFRRREKLDFALQRGDPVMLGARVEGLIADDVAPAEVGAIEIGGGVDVEMADAAEESER